MRLADDGPHARSAIRAAEDPRRRSRWSVSDPGTFELNRRTLLGAVSAGTAVPAGALADATPDSGASFNGRRIDVRDFGARGDRQHDDGPAIAAAIAEAARHDQYPASVFLPAGHYHRRDTIALRNHLNVTGEGDGSVLNSQGDVAFHRPILANATPDGLVHARLSDLSLLGGSHGLKLIAAAENADLRLTNVGMDMQSVANIEADKLFQTVKILNCSFGRAPYGLKVNGYGTNLLVSIASEWTDHTDAAISLRGAEAVTFIGNRFEGGGLTGKVSIDIEDANTISFIGCWFEDVHETLCRFRDIAGQVLFQSCHFTGTKLGGTAWRGFAWDVGDCRIAFRDCLSVVPMIVDGHVALDGSVGIGSSRAVIEGSDRAGSVAAAPRPVTSPRTALLSIAPSRSAAWSIMGRLTLAVLDASGSILWQRETGEVALRSGGTERRLTDAAAPRIAARPESGGKLVIEADVPVPAGARLWWRFNWVAIEGGVIVRGL